MDVSIVITSYNYANYLSECIKSCLNQEASGLTYEVLVVDDGSTDETPVLLAGWESDRLRKFRIQNSGIEVASNYGFSNARGNYLVRVDADDMLLPTYLKEMRPCIEARWPFIYSDYQEIDANGCRVRDIFLPEFELNEIFARGDFLATGTLYERNIVAMIGGYPTTLKNSGLENYEMVLTIIRKGCVGKHVRRVLFAYRRHPNNLSETKKAQIVDNGQLLFDRFSLGAYSTNQFHPYNLRLLS